MHTNPMPPTLGRIVIVRRRDGAPLIIGGAKTVLEPDGGTRLVVAATSASIAHVLGGPNDAIAAWVGPKLVTAQHESFEAHAPAHSDAVDAIREEEYVWSWPPRIG